MLCWIVRFLVNRNEWSNWIEYLCGMIWRVWYDIFIYLCGMILFTLCELKCWAVCEINIIHCCVRKWMILLLIYSVWVLLYWAVCYVDVRIECHSCCVLIWMSFIYIILYVIRAVAIVFWTCCVIWFRYTNIGLAVWSGPYSRALDLLCDLVFIAQAICYSTTVYDREWFPLLCAIVDITRVIICYSVWNYMIEPVWFVVWVSYYRYLYGSIFIW